MAINRKKLETRLWILAADVLWGYGVYQAVTNMLTKGISTGMLFGATFCTACILPSFGIFGKDIMKFISNVKNKNRKKDNERNDDNAFEQGKDISQTKNIDPRFQGQENPPKIERQSPSPTQSRSQEDSREP